MRDKSKRNEQHLYRFWRNKVTSLIRKAKQQYFKEELNSNKGNSKAIWEILRNAQSNDPQQKNKHTPQMIIMNEKKVSDTFEIANTFNKFFTSITSQYVHACDTNNSSCLERVKTYVSSRLPTGVKFNIPLVSTDYVLKSLKSVNSRKATGLDGISAYVLKMAAEELACSLTHILNRSIQSNKFPTEWKNAKVTPVHKSDSKLDVSNYRPISVLPVLSKILEKHVHEALNSYLTKFKLLRSNQSGFREKHSCETALIKIIDEWMEAIDNGYLIGTVFVDLRKAFDLVDHNILIQKLSLYGLSNDATQWFKTYLTGRTQCTVIDKVSLLR